MHKVYFSLGANLGNRAQTIQCAIHKMKELIGPVIAQSALHETEPWGFSSQHPFLNAAVCCHTSLNPQQVLVATQQIERQLGRTAKTGGTNYKDRPIDIDILLYDNLTVNLPHLKIPHPLMHQRAFVMQPLSEIMKDIPSASENVI